MGFLFGVANAIASSFQASFFKKLSGVSPFVVNWFRFVVALPLLVVLVSIFVQWKIPEPKFWLLLLGISLPVELLQSYFHVTAFQRSPQSIVGPLFSLSPIFLIPLGYIFLGELPSFIGALGVLSVMVGPFFLGWQSAGIINALKNVFREPGSWRMVLSAIFGALAVTFAKFSYQYVSPLLFAFYITISLAAVLTFYLIFTGGSPTKAFSRQTLIMSLAYSMGQVFHYVGLSFLLAAYYISIKRLSIVFDVIFGRFIHKEDHFQPRLIGALFMVIGVILIAFG